MKRIVTFLFILAACWRVEAQERLDSLPGYQPTIMVIPFAREGEDWRERMEDDLLMRTALTNVREGFDAAGYATVDLRARLRQLANDRAMNWDNQTSIKQEVIELSGADIYVEVEPMLNRSHSGNNAGVILTAYDAFSGVSLANHTAHSPSFYTEQYNRLVQKAVERALPEFLPQITEKMDEMMMAGRLAALEIHLSPSALYDLDREVEGGDLLLSEVILNWLDEHTYRGQYHIQGITSTVLLIDQMRIPFFDPANGRPYRAHRFAIRLRNFLEELGVESSRDVQGNKIFITLN